MSKNAMAGAVTLCGVGLCMIGGAQLLQSGSSANAAGSTLGAAAAVAAAANAQTGPTVVWYGTAVHGTVLAFFRCWSDGRVEYMLSERQGCSYGDYCGTGLIWQTLSSATQGYRAAADINADERVDGADLASVLGNWGDAPRVPFPPSTCPLDLINP